MLADDLIALEEAGASVTVGMVDDDGWPMASRGFGLVVADADPLRVELLVPTASLEAVGRGPGSPPFAIAVTISAVALFRSTQIKGTAHDVRSPVEAQITRARQALTTLFEALGRYAGDDIAIMPTVMPEAMLWVTVDVAEAFDQTPGPGAGRAVGSGSG